MLKDLPKKVLSSGKSQPRSEAWEASTLTALAAEPAGKGRLPTANWEKPGPALLEQLSLNTRAEAGDRAFIQRRQELRAEELVGSRRRFWVMKYMGNVWKSETKRPVGIVWLLVGNPPLAHAFMFLGTCSKPAFLPLKIYSKTEKDWWQHICLSSCREQPWPPCVD